MIEATTDATPAATEPVPSNPGTPEKRTIRLGMVPLTDSAPLVVAHDLGFFEKEGIDATLTVEPSWASIRDKVAVGVLDGAQMLAPLPIAMTLGLSGVRTEMISPMTLSLNGNAITGSLELFHRLSALDPIAVTSPDCVGPLLRRLIDRDKTEGRPPLTFASVFPFSMHEYQLRHWLTRSGIDPDNGVRLIIVPPPNMVDRLRAGELDGFCVGEPWNQLAVHLGLGRVMLTGRDIWRDCPEKVFAVTKTWADAYPYTLAATLRALRRACSWLASPEHREQAAVMLTSHYRLSAPLEVVRSSLMGLVRMGLSEPPRHLPDMHVFPADEGAAPQLARECWVRSQMVRWNRAISSE